MSTEFQAASAVSLLGDGRYEAQVHDGWDIGGNANGGYLMAIAARAMLAETDRTDPVTITGHYLAPARPGPAEVNVEPIRTGRRFSTASAQLAVGGQPILQALGTFGDLANSAGAGPTALADPDLALPPIEDCVGASAGDGFVPQLQHKLSVALKPGDDGFRSGSVAERTGVASMSGYFALADSAVVDTVDLLLAADGFPPAIFNSDISVGWVPTVELTVHVRGRPAPGPVACRFETKHLQDGLFEEDGQGWDADGRLVFLSRQLALTPLDASSPRGS